jgi:hypothetical protein
MHMYVFHYLVYHSDTFNYLNVHTQPFRDLYYIQLST